ncbi:MAG: leucine-rich repeat domain-containing protein [Lachnospiraceae bacterium]|nr:leucine-rich repeat domain-containing protein [Lachnospiraceae bacterium]
MRFRNVLCFSMAAVLACSSLPANVAQAESLQTREGTEKIVQAQADWEPATETMIQEEVKGADNDSEYETKSGWKYKMLKNGTLEITGYSGKKTSLTIPSKIAEKKVSSIGDYAFSFNDSNCPVFDKLKSVKIPGTVKKIGEGAFSYCSSLKSIKIPKGVTSIGDKTFYFCEKLKSVEFSNTVKSIGEMAFWCTSLKSLTIPKSLTKISDKAFAYIWGLKAIKVQSGNPAYCAKEGILFTKDKKTLVCCPMDKKGSYTVPKGVKTIGNGAFAYTNLKNIKFQKGLITIEKDAFFSSGLKNVVFPEGLKTIGESALNMCYQLENVTIPKSVKKIGENAIRSGISTNPKLKLKVVRGSYAQKWAKRNNIPYSYIK